MVIGLALLILICCFLPEAVADSTGTRVENNAIPNPNNSVLTINSETIPVSEVTNDVVDTTSIQTIIPTVASTVNPTASLVQTEMSPVLTSADITTIPVQQKSLSPDVERKISTNLLYMIDSNTPEIGLSRVEAQNTMQREGKLKAVTKTTSTGSKSIRTDSSTTQTSNLVLVYIDLIPSASTSIVDSYISSVTESNEQDHSVVAWVDANNLDSLASLDAVSNVRTAEPSITKDSPVYHDTKFVNKRAGLPEAGIEEIKTRVREFEKVPGIKLVQLQIMKTPRGNAYEMVSDNSRYYVNAKTGEVELASYGYNSNLPVQNKKYSKIINFGNNQNALSLTDDTALTIAQDFVAENYCNYYNRTMVLSRSQLIDHGDAGKTYYFIWVEKINDILTPNSIAVSVNAYNGKILSYIGIDQPLDVNIISSVSKDAATQKAVVQFSPITISNTNARLAVLSQDESNQKLVWIVHVEGEPKEGLEQGGDVIIDAHSGEIVEVDPYA